MHRLIHEIISKGPVLTDGAWGTQLQAQGLAAGECPDGWNLSHPERVEAVARAYVAAGSQIILTNTFRANRIALADCGLAGSVVEINRKGAEISKRAAAGKAGVFASIGPSGKMLFTGEVSEEELLAAFSEQAKALAEGGADGLVVETMSDPAEAKVALLAAKETGLPVVVSMVYDSGKDKDRTMTGTTPEQAAVALTEAGADVIGGNCGQGIASYVPIAKRLRTATDRPIWIKANAGLPTVVDGRATWHIAPEEYASHARALIEAGASFVGGCCGTSPEFIQALKKALKPCS